MRTYRSFLAFALGVVMAIASASQAALAGFEPIQVSPSRLILQARPGEQVTGAVQVTNTGTGKASPKAVLYDWTTDTAGNPILAAEGTYADSTMKGWLKFNPRAFTIEARQTQVVRFSIKVPIDAKPGERRCMIAFEQAVSDENSPTIMNYLLTTTVYLAVLPVSRTAEVAGLNIVRNASLEADGESSVVELVIKSTGNGHFRGRASFEVTAEGADTPVAKGSFPLIVALPQAYVVAHGDCMTLLPKGRYTVAVSVTPENSPNPPVVISQIVEVT